MDRRLTPANGRVAAAFLQGVVQAAEYVTGTPATVGAVVMDLCRAPGGPRDTQLALGAGVRVYETRDGWAFVQADADGYCGYVRADALGPHAPPTHRVGVLATHAYAAEDIKAPDLLHLPFGAQVTVVDERKTMFETTVGFVPKRHLRPLDRPFADPVTVAQMLFNTPYLWGGTTAFGIDCSGLVQAALLACGQTCPRDSGQQREALGVTLAEDAPLQRGDLVFWAGHVGMMVDEATLLHANAHHMAVAYEPLIGAVARIAAREFGAVLRRARM